MFFDVIEYLDPTGEVMVARIPQNGSGDFTTGSQLVVQENQIAVFYRDGQMADQFTAEGFDADTGEDQPDVCIGPEKFSTSRPRRHHGR